MSVRAVLFAAAALAMMGGVSHATDLTVPAEPQPMIADVGAAGFSWDGMYVGLEVGGLYYDADNSYGLIGLNAGVNMVPSGNFLLGLEGDLQYLTGDNGDFTHLAVLGKAGMIAMPNLLLYATGGVGVEENLDSSSSTATFGIYELGAGVEVGMTDHMALRGQVVSVGFFNGDDPGVKATAGLQFHM
jgi:outer membrane immunogenic protein